MTETSDKSVISRWKQIIKNSDETFSRAQQSGDKWGSDGIANADDYEKRFASVTEQGFSFERWASERKMKGLSTHVIELFGGAYIFDDFSDLDSLLGVRLANIDEALKHKYKDQKSYLKRLRKMVSSSKRTILEGNLFRALTWIRIKKYLASHSTEKADLIVIKPLAGLRNKDSSELSRTDALLYFQLFQRAYHLVSDNGGMILMHLPSAFYYFFDELHQYLMKIPNLDVQVDDRVLTLKIVKNGIS